ncbi:MFS transporter [Nocardioides insulae]|uniref:MFS transporter n=1 Tax=Nocardioides insulae TaxID=394734 RepID=UPI000687052F|nr:MFS transporter [Nocardioides insulae]
MPEPAGHDSPALPSARTEEGYLPGTPGHRRIVLALFFAGLSTFALLYSTQAILPDLARAFDVSTSATTWTVSLSTLGLAVALLVTGPFSDVVGRTRLIHFSLTCSALVALASAAAPTWGTLLALRLLAGVALAGLPAVATAYLREELHASTHGRAAGLYVGGTAIGGMTGRLLTGWVADLSGWRWALAAVAVLAVGCAIAVRVLLPASRGFRPVPAGVRMLLTSTRRALADPALLMLYAVGGCAMGALVGVFNTVGFRLEEAPFGLGVGATSLLFLVYPLGSFSSAYAGRLADRYGRRAVLPVGAAVAVLGVVLTVPAWLPTVVAGVALMLIGFFVVHGVASGWVPTRAHAGGVATGQAASLYLFTYYAGSSVFGTFAGHAWTSGGWAAVAGFAVALFAITGVLGLVLRQTRALTHGAADPAVVSH